MKIDRSRFLLLATALATGSAASACTVTSTTVTTDGGGASATDATAATDGTVAATDSGGDASPSGDAAADGGTAKETGASCDDTVVDGGTVNCDNAVGTDAGLTGCGADPRANGFCSTIQANFKPQVAQNAIHCFEVAPACESVGGCVVAAAAAACPDPTAPAFCQSVVTSCGDAGTPAMGPDGGAFEGACEQAASGLTGTGRATFKTCYAGGGCADIEACIAQLSQ